MNKINTMPELLFVESYRINIYVIQQYVEPIIDAVKDVVSLKYGNYDGVSWCSAPGTERFVPRSGGNPQAGEVNKAHSVSAIKIEFTIPREKQLLSKVIEAARSNHPWDEPVISISETIDTRSNGII